MVSTFLCSRRVVPSIGTHVTVYRIAVNTDDVLVDAKMVAEMVEQVEVQEAIPGGNRIWALGRKMDEKVVAKVDDFARKTANLGYVRRRQMPRSTGKTRSVDGKMAQKMGTKVDAERVIPGVNGIALVAEKVDGKVDT